MDGCEQEHKNRFSKIYIFMSLIFKSGAGFKARRVQIYNRHGCTFVINLTRFQKYLHKMIVIDA